MLYNTHKRYGQVASLVMVPVTASVGLVEVSKVNELADSLFLGVNVLAWAAIVLVAYFASLFGAKFPDIDGYGKNPSIPAKKHKVWAKMFKMFGVKHRGKFSHDFVSQAIFWGVIGGLVTVIGNMFELNASLVFLAQVYVLFVLIGVYSHLIADALTVEGVWFLGFRIKLMPVFIKKINIFGWKPFKKWFTTESKWDAINYRLMTFALPLVIVYMVMEISKLV